MPTVCEIVEDSTGDVTSTDQIDLFYDENLIAEDPIEEQLTQEEMD